VKRDFLQLSDLSPDEHRTLFQRARELKSMRRSGEPVRTLEGRSLLLLFEKRHPDPHLVRGGHRPARRERHHAADGREPDRARRDPGGHGARRFALRGRDHVPHPRGRSAARFRAGRDGAGDQWLSDGGHPVQILADLFTVEEKIGDIKGKRVAFVGDCASNMARSYLEAAPIFGFELRLAGPDGYWPQPSEMRGAHIDTDVGTAVSGADVVATDVWVSMGRKQKRRSGCGPSRVQRRRDLMASAKPEAIVLHCLPAHRGEEISANVLEGARSAVWDEAENRLHVQKALLEKLILRK